MLPLPPVFINYVGVADQTLRRRRRPDYNIKVCSVGLGDSPEEEGDLDQIMADCRVPSSSSMTGTVSMAKLIRGSKKQFHW
ncbi:hypothetical protein L2E82_01714 [Cichorium intybus]|uniref:Uncharacterized protein n=1 Tax=Cichorium intybus TaxID=13427 RepID=A0ACB9H0A7_CICIN|nr:hypothetical protein L2E82_01714 [Cichorium intybus]